jgi:hypothetical protein
MLPYEDDLGSSAFQDLGYQETQPAVPKNHYARAGLEAHLLENLGGGGRRLDKDGRLIRNGGGNSVEIPQGQRHVLGKAACTAHDSHNCAVRAVAGQAAETPRAFTTCDVDFAHHPLADPR